MIQFYASMIKRGALTLAQVAALWRENVQAAVL